MFVIGEVDHKETIAAMSTITSPPTTTEQDYDVPTLAVRCRCSARHVWRQIDAGKIPGVYRLGNLVRINRGVVEEWLRSGAK